MEALIHPLMGGISFAYVSSIEASSLLEETSHSGHSTRIPCFLRRRIIFNADIDDAPDRDGAMMFLAPLLASHSSIIWPIPPSPPATT